MSAPGPRRAEAPDWNPAQRAAIEIEGRDLLVTAGAGTGKTSVLVERVLYKLRRKRAELDQLLVVTFTEKAAQEMKDRIGRALAEDPELRHQVPQLPRASISTIHAFCARLLREHFLEAGVEPAFGVLDENSRTEALQEALRRSFHGWYAKGERELGREFQALIELTGFEESGEVLRKVVRRLHEFARATPDPEEYLEGLVGRQPATRLEDLPWYPEMTRQLERIWGRGTRLYRQALDLAERGGRRTEAHRAFHEALRELTPQRMADAVERRRLVEEWTARGLAETDRGLQLCFPVAPGGAREIHGFKECHEAAKAAFKHAVVRSLPWPEEEFLQDEAHQRRHLRVLVDLVRRMDEDYQLYKRRHGRLDFSDLEIHTARLLRDHGAALGLDTRFREVLVDEFQDVNALQDGILRMLSPESGRFRVGDVKQSIYQFRLADPTIFLKLARNRTAVRSLEDVGAQTGNPGPVVPDPSAPRGSDPLVVYLAENHRSRPAILRFVNAVFSRLFDPAALGSSYAEQALVPSRTEPGGAAPIELWLLDRSTERDLAHTEIEHEARFTALRLARLIREEKPAIPERDGTLRPAEWRDVVLCLRSHAHADAFLEALREEGIPAYLADGGRLLEEEGVRDLRALLSVIDNPRDDVALAAVLRSPFLAVPDSDLLRVRLAWPQARTLLDAVAATAYEADPAAEGGAFWPPRAAASGGSRDPRSSAGAAGSVATLPFAWTGPRSEEAPSLLTARLRRRLREFLDRVRSWREAEPRTDLVRFLAFLLEETRFHAVLHGRGHGSREIAALEKFLALARDDQAERGPSLHGFLTRLAEVEAAGELHAVPLNSGSEDAVSILTIHKAKGLEFPIVVLPQLEWRFQRDRLGYQVRIGPEWVGLTALDFENWVKRDTPARWVLAEAQEQAVRAEEGRIFYVALTRARERLILVGAAMRRPGFEGALPEGSMRDLLQGKWSTLDWLLTALPWPEAEPVERAAPPMPGTSGSEAGNEAPGAREDPPAAVVFPSFPLRVEWISQSGIRWPEAAATEASGPGAPSRNARPEPWRERISAGLPLEVSGSPDLTAEIDALLRRVGTPVPFAPLARLDDLKGKYWVTEFKQLSDRERADSLPEEGTGIWHPPVPDANAFRRPPGAAAEAAALRGTRYHAALARLDLTALDAEALDRQFAAFSREAWWEGAPRDPGLEQGMAACLRTPLGRRLESRARAGKEIQREVSFTLKWTLRELSRFQPSLRAAIAADPRWRRGSWADALEHSWVLLQGRIDCLFQEADGWTLLDWKTDAIPREGVAERARLYTSQMALYREAASRLWGAPVRAFLAFLAVGEVVEAPEAESGSRGETIS